MVIRACELAERADVDGEERRQREWVGAVDEVGAVLLDLNDPTQVIGRLREPLLSPEGNEREGYVPNVVYSCGSMTHAGKLILPYAMSDKATGIASIALDKLLAEMLRE